ncbi:MAG: phosphohydrolase [Nitrospira bacterium SG8_3]|nr:MAG: phosphohydrolase [Nitrospira bacterium SG8_3]
MALTIEDIKAFAEKCCSNSLGSHDWEHSLRVYNLCMHIGQAEGADMEVLKIAAYLHDVGRSHQDESKGTICHAEKGAEIATELLDKYPISTGRKVNILHCIRSHRFRGNREPATLEAKILFDADKLDSIGAIGIARAFQFAGEVGAKFHNPNVSLEETRPYSKEDTGYREFKLKLSRIKERMLTAEGHRMAEERHAFMEKYFERFFLEYQGEK